MSLMADRISAYEDYVSIEEQIKDLENRFKYKELLTIQDLRDVFGWSRTTAYAKIEEGIFIPFGDVPKDAKRIPKKIVFAYYRSLF
jgi:vacuolar-type H+-ATPase subunit I/STV1